MRFLTKALEYFDRGWSVLPVGTDKRPMLKRWKKYQSERPSEALVMLWFSQPEPMGIAVVLGPVSGDLMCRDFDDSESYHRWAESQPEKAAELPTSETARGFHVFFTGRHPKRHALGDGELRGGGDIIVLPPSIHASGVEYKWLRPPNGEIPKADPFVEGLLQKQASQDAPPMASDISDISEFSDISVPPMTVEEAIRLSLPLGEGTRNEHLFKFARILKSMPKYANADLEELRPIVKEWHRQAQPKIATKPFFETWIDFNHGWSRVCVPWGQNMDDAYRDAMRADPPKCADKFEEPKFKNLIRLCRELQRRSGDSPFHLSTRIAGGLLGISAMQASRALRLLLIEKVIKVICKGGVGKNAWKATRFRYLGD